MRIAGTSLASAKAMAGVVAIACAVCAPTAWARGEARSLATTLAQGVESCVDASVIRFRADERYAVLDSADAQMASDAFAARYPIVAQTGLAPSDVMLWRHPRYGWVYVALLANPAKAGEICFTSVFSAAAFDITPRLLRKYF